MNFKRATVLGAWFLLGFAIFAVSDWKSLLTILVGVIAIECWYSWIEGDKQ